MGFERVTLLRITFYVIVLGGIGGILNALFTDNGFILPKYEITKARRIWRPGFFGNIVSGMAASFIAWGLSGPFVNYLLVTNNEELGTKFYLSLGNAVGAFLTGIGGARLVTSEVDKQLLTAAAAAAAQSPASPEKAAVIAAASPVNALNVAQNDTDTP